MSADMVPAPGDALAQQLLGSLQTRWETHARTRRVIGVAGESGSGKSVTADRLAHACRAAGVQTMVLNQDNYFVRPPRTNHEYREQDLAHVGPHEVNLALLSEHIAAFRARANGVIAPLVDYPGNRFVTQTLNFADAELLIVEGTYVLMLEALDARVFMAATHEETYAQRVARNRAAAELSPFVTTVLGIEHRLIAPQRAVADYIVDAQFRLTCA
jgi:uridine kinase